MKPNHLLFDLLSRNTDSEYAAAQKTEGPTLKRDLDLRDNKKVFSARFSATACGVYSAWLCPLPKGTCVYFHLSLCVLLQHTTLREQS